MYLASLASNSGWGSCLLVPVYSAVPIARKVLAGQGPECGSRCSMSHFSLSIHRDGLSTSNDPNTSGCLIPIARVQMPPNDDPPNARRFGSLLPPYLSDTNGRISDTTRSRYSSTFPPGQLAASFLTPPGPVPGRTGV